MTPERGWSWKVGDRDANEGLGLRYEPGSLGDLLKGEWALAVARALVSDPGPIRYLDPFAGAPVYPRVAAVDARLEELPPTEYGAAQEPFAARGELASTATLVRDVCDQAGVRLFARVFDADPERRALWAAAAWAELMPGEDGGAILGEAGPTDLLNVDPYDLFERWEELVPPALRRAPHEAALFYLFNKAPRGSSQFTRYRNLRESIAALLEAEGDLRGLLVGRIPSDAVLPRAFHEVLLVAPRPLIAAVRGPLGAVTRVLATELALRGAFEAG